MGQPDEESGGHLAAFYRDIAQLIPRCPNSPPQVKRPRRGDRNRAGAANLVGGFLPAGASGGFGREQGIRRAAPSSGSIHTVLIGPCCGGHFLPVY
jgi:hypothetical protein